MKLKLVVVVISSCFLFVKIASKDFDEKNTDYPSEYGKVCGLKWQQKYIDLHKSILNGDRPGKFIIAVPVHAGLADVMLGYVSTFLWALLTNSAFMIARVDRFWDNTTRHIEFGYHSPFINWIAPNIDAYLPCVLPPYPSIIPCKEEKIRMFKKGNISSVVYVDAINGGTKNDFTNPDNNVYIVVQNRGVTYDVMTNAQYNARLHEIGMTKRNIFPCIFNFLFKMNPGVCTNNCEKTLKALRINHRDDKNFIRIGLQIRYSAYSPGIFRCADSLIDLYKKQGKTVVLLLVSYKIDVQEAAKAKYGDVLLLPDGKPAAIVEVHDRQQHLSHDEEKARDTQAVMESARDFYLLSLTDVQIISTLSGFGTMGSVIRPSNHHVMYGVGSKEYGTSYVDDPKAPLCSTYPEGEPLSKFAHSWSGLRH